MSFVTALCYDKFMARTEKACLQAWRNQLLQQVNGMVLEVGAGTGANIKYYPEQVSQLVLAEPDKHMRKHLKKYIAGQRREGVSVISSTAEKIDADDETFDFIVSTLVCCSVTNLASSLAEFRRVLKPDGRLVFLEHVAAPEGTSRRRWQDRINPIWKLLMGNCHLNRQTEQAIIKAGFNLINIERQSMRKALPIVRPTIRGVAVKATYKQVNTTNPHW